MKSRKIKLFWLIVFLLVCLTGCGTGSPETSTADTTDTGTPGEYYIILPQSATAKLAEAADSLARAMTELGATPEVVKENRLPDAMPSGAYRILLGMTSLPETAAVYQALPYGAQTIKSVAGALVVGGWYEDNTLAAVNTCRKMMSAWIADGRLNVPDDYEKTVDLNATLSALPQFPGVWPSAAVDCGDGRMMLILKTDEAGYNSYRNGLSAAQYRPYSENRIANNHFSTYENGTYAIHTVCYTGTGETRLMIEPLAKSALAPLPTGDTRTAVRSTLTQIGLHAEEDTPAGMSYLFRLEDGSFLIIDGGYNRDVDANRLYNVMRSQTEAGKPIVIAAWILTHGHIDHSGCFMRFTELYRDQVTVERFIYNDPAADQRNITGDGPFYLQNRAAMEKYAGAVIHKAVPGQLFGIRNAKIQIYYTYELFAPKSLSYYNDCSIVFSVETGGQKLMFLADISENSSPLIASLYRESLQCDLLQVAHHGYVGGTAALYQYLNPTYLLWPSADSVYETRITADRFKPLPATVKDRNKNCFVAGNRIITLELTPGGVTLLHSLAAGG